MTSSFGDPSGRLRLSNEPARRGTTPGGLTTCTEPLIPVYKPSPPPPGVTTTLGTPNKHRNLYGHVRSPEPAQLPKRGSTRTPKPFCRVRVARVSSLNFSLNLLRQEMVLFPPGLVFLVPYTPSNPLMQKGTSSLPPGVEP